MKWTGPSCSLEIERQALQKEKDKASKERLANLEKDLANLREAGSELNARWSMSKRKQSRRSGISRVKLDETETEIERG